VRGEQRGVCFLQGLPQPMNLEEEILREHSKPQTIRIAKWIGKDRRRYRELMQLLLNGERLITQRAAWILIWCHDIDPQLITPWIPALLKKMQEPDVHDALKRNVVGILQCCEIPSSQLGKVATLCFDYLGAPETPIAVRCNAMTVLQRIADREPDLKRELKTAIELMLPYGGPAIQARARMVIKKLDAELSLERMPAAGKKGKSL
jgi:hypothetical protein